MSKSPFFQMPPGMQNPFDLRIRLCQTALIDQWTYSGIIHPCWLLYWNPDPGAEILYENSKWQMDAERVFLIPPFTRFSTRSTGSFRHCYIHFETSAPFDRVRRGILTFPGSAVRTFFRKAAGKKPPESGPALLQAMLCHYLGEIPDGQFLEPGNSILDPAVRRAAELMNKYLKQPLPNRELCRRSGMNLNVFYQKFRQEMGMTPKHYLLSLRMEQAREKLLHSDLPLEEIAELTGYADRFHFSKAFRQFYGEPPASYRKKYRI